MGILEDLNAPNIFEGSDLSGNFTTIVVMLVLFFIILGVGFFAFKFYSKKYVKAQYKNQIPIYVEGTSGKFQRIGVDWAKELFVPDSNISLFYLKNRKIYLARPTRTMGKDEYWYYISTNGEWVNFDISKNEEDNALANVNYDHRDTRYAFVNLTDIIKKNFRDKTVSWWKEYSNVITIVIVAVMFIALMWFFFWRTGDMIEHMTPLVKGIESASKSMVDATENLRNLNSGIISRG